METHGSVVPSPSSLVEPRIKKRRDRAPSETLPEETPLLIEETPQQIEETPLHSEETPLTTTIEETPLIKNLQ